MLLPLVTPEDLQPFPGSPFAGGAVNAAASSVRRDAGWHIAPSVTETVTVESSGGPFLFLQTLYLTAVTAVRNVTTPDSPQMVDGWSKAPTLRFRAGMLSRTAGWPCGVFEVDITHGYDQCPDDLLPVLAARAQSYRVNQASGSVRLGSLSINNDGPAVAGGADATVASYKILTRP